MLNKFYKYKMQESFSYQFKSIYIILDNKLIIIMVLIICFSKYKSLIYRTIDALGLKCTVFVCDRQVSINLHSTFSGIGIQNGIYTSTEKLQRFSHALQNLHCCVNQDKCISRLLVNSAGYGNRREIVTLKTGIHLL